MLRIVLIQPGSTEFDDQGRIKGSLDIPLSPSGMEQADRIAEELADIDIDIVYSAPCQSALQTARTLVQDRGIRVKRIEKLRNLDHGLWHGKRIADVRQRQPRVYRQCQEYPDMVCPPEGEPVAAGKRRIQAVLAKIIRRHRDETVALVVPEPTASFVRSHLQQQDSLHFWQAERDSGRWSLIDVIPDQIAVGG